ncbi:MAG: nucleoside triphosphate pyrophosphohydrolase [Myxococcota bacterium]
MSERSKVGERAPRIAAVMARLLGDEGCPWDRAQSLRSLRPYVVEEAFEVVEAIDALEAAGAASYETQRGEAAPAPEPLRAALRDELGDLLFQVVFQSALAERQGWFDLDDVVDAIASKMERRHPWVFGSEEAADDADTALSRWEAMKAKEKRERGALGGVPAAMPALLRAHRVGAKAAAVGYDWPDPAGVLKKVQEEVGELEAALASGDDAAIEEELGDALFALASLARKRGLDAEAALRKSLEKFSRRFRHAELAAGEDGLKSLTDEGRDALWEAAKAAEA